MVINVGVFYLRMLRNRLYSVCFLITHFYVTKHSQEVGGGGGVKEGGENEKVRRVERNVFRVCRLPSQTVVGGWQWAESNTTC